MCYARVRASWRRRFRGGGCWRDVSGGPGDRGDRVARARAAEAGNRSRRVATNRSAVMEDTRSTASESESVREMPARDELLRLYMSEAAATPLLTAEEEITLARAVGAGARAAERLASEAVQGDDRITLEADVAAGEAARKRLIEANLRLVVS